jgi:hypothetical protein
MGTIYRSRNLRQNLFARTENNKLKGFCLLINAKQINETLVETVTFKTSQKRPFQGRLKESRICVIKDPF